VSCTATSRSVAGNAPIFVRPISCSAKNVSVLAATDPSDWVNAIPAVSSSLPSAPSALRSSSASVAVSPGVDTVGSVMPTRSDAHSG